MLMTWWRGKEAVAVELPEEAKVCNCACCGQLLLGRRERRWRARQNDPDLPAIVAGRIHGRPYCPDCLRPNSRKR